MLTNVLFSLFQEKINLLKKKYVLYCICWRKRLFSLFMVKTALLQNKCYWINFRWKLSYLRKEKGCSVLLPCFMKRNLKRKCKRKFPLSQTSFFYMAVFFLDDLLTWSRANTEAPYGMIGPTITFGSLYCSF